MSKAIAINSVDQFQDRSPSLFPNAVEWAMLKEQAQLAVESGLLPAAVNTPAKAIVIAMKGRELGIPVMHAFAHINVISGKPAIDAELMLSLIYKNCRGAVVNYLETTDKRCEIEAKRPGGKPAKFSFTIQDATAAQLMSKDGWKKYPAAMLRARTISIVARAMFPDATMGCGYVPEELGADVDGEGNVIVLPPAEPQQNAPSVDATIEPKTPPPTGLKITPKSDGPTRASVWAEAVALGKQINWTEKDVENFLVEKAAPKPLKDMPPAKVKEFVDELVREYFGPGSET